MWVDGHEGHIFEEELGVPLRCVTCSLDLRPKKKRVEVGGRLECDGDGACSADAVVHVEIS